MEPLAPAPKTPREKRQVSGFWVSRVMHEDGVEELAGFVVGGRVLVEEDEGVHLAEVDLQLFPGAGLVAAEGQGNGGLVPGLAQHGHGVVRIAALHAEGAGVGLGVGTHAVEALALTEAELGEDVAFGVADVGQGQGDEDVAPVV